MSFDVICRFLNFIATIWKIIFIFTKVVVGIPLNDGFICFHIYKLKFNTTQM